MINCETKKGSEPTKCIYGFDADHKMVKEKTEEEIASWLKEMGINAIFIHHQDESLIEALHNSGIKVYLSKGIFIGKKYWEKYPNSRPLTAKCKSWKLDWHPCLNPIIKELRQEKIEDIRKLVRESKIDGIWLDFIRWPALCETSNPELTQASFDTITIKKFLDDTKISINWKSMECKMIANIILDEYKEEWKDWKCKQITSFISKVREIIDTSDRDILLGAFTVPWREKDYNGAILSVIGQDYNKMGKLLDVISPMVYHIMTGNKTEWVGEVTEWAASKAACEIWPITQIIDRPTDSISCTSEQIEKSMKAALQAKGADGIILFTFRALNNSKVEVIKNIFKGSFQ
jgi:uncharacterized lipoprotein YddW (UPF0748 family)